MELESFENLDVVVDESVGHEVGADVGCAVDAAGQVAADAGAADVDVDAADVAEFEVVVVGIVGQPGSCDAA